ncbi:helix-turn-helix transcriptional regulator [Microbacterium dextranolyticum]|uniref:Protein pafC n=1 Tax=Microbacterium dextranolyticum TaxID=36806 RepID=A0A9W6HN40_9MICO|nr:WYL domain-containing protein [Microbacterium dextranolyticum]MBM7463100.1 proteasome accessory factor C [Microbacterium dextranolyticum]GLJ95794.1 protein pafC [Microbacterium dextranolyticum]
MSARPLLATDRAALILQLVPYLIGKGEVSLVDAAEDFEVTPEQMRAMVEKLTVIGLPGEGGFWQMANDLFDIDWDLLDQQDLIVITNAVGLERTPRLTAREAAALLAGLQLAASLPGVGDSGVVQGLLAKLARGTSGAPADVIVAPERVDDVRAAVAEALRRGVAVSFGYQAPDAPATTRTVDPVKVHIAGGQWYLQGWCHLREAVRTFHLDRVSDVRVTDIPTTHGADAVPDLFEPGDGDVEVQVRYRHTISPLLADFVVDERDAHDGLRIASIRLGDARSLKRLAARLGGELEILGPTDAREATAAWAQAGLEQYR